MHALANTSAGYAGIFVLMTLESALIPIPSEATMLFAGFKVDDGTLTLFGIVAAGVLGNLVGNATLVPFPPPTPPISSLFGSACGGLMDTILPNPLPGAVIEPVAGPGGGAVRFYQLD